MRGLVARGRRALPAVLVAAAACGPTGTTPAHEVEIGGDLVLRTRLVSTRRVGRTDFEYTYAAALENTGAASPNVVVVLSSSSPDTEVIDGALHFPPLAAGATVASVDAFVLRQDRRSPFDLEALSFALGASAPALAQSDPAASEDGVPRTAWFRLEFASILPDGIGDALSLDCDGEPTAPGRAIDVTALDATTLVVNPAEDLPSGVACTLRWPGPGDVAALPFATAPAGPPAIALYDRADPTRVGPLPDDTWSVSDPSTRTGRRLDVPVPDRGPVVGALYAALLHDANALDGWSPIAHAAIELSEPADPASLPATPAESLDPFATAGLYDLTPGSDTYGERVPFLVSVRDDTTAQGRTSRTLLAFPSIPLRSGGRYAFALSRRAFATPGRPFDPSLFFAQALGPPQPGEAPELARVREVLEPALEALAHDVVPAVLRQDLALVLVFSVRSTDDIPDDLLAIAQQVLDADPPEVLACTIEPEDPAQIAGGSRVAAIVRGTWDAPDWRLHPAGQSLPNPNVERDGDGLPVLSRTRPVEFVLAIPDAEGPVPMIFHQHGNPGSLVEVISNARRFLSQAGFATVGFTDILNREVAPQGGDAGVLAQAVNIIASLLANGTPPEHWLETTAEQLAFLRMIPTLGDLDCDVVGDPAALADVPELDVAAPLSYHGISEGGNNGQALVPYAPELAAAALVVGGARLGETLIHQQAQTFLQALPAAFPGVTPAEIWELFALFQTDFDVQDRQNHLEFAYRGRVPVGGTTRKPSVLLIEGIDDSLVPNHVTDSAAWLLGPVPHLAPVQRAVPFLEVVSGPVQANVDAETTAAYFQYVPVGVPGIDPTPGCTELSETSAREGHFCAQSARESRAQRVHFFESALAGVPEIVDPFSLP